MALALVTCVVFSAGNLVFTAAVFRSLCGVIGAQVRVYEEVPPSTATGAYAAGEWIKLRKRICRI